MNANGEKLRDACQAAFLTFQKIKSSEFSDIQSKLEFCIGSYDFDKNPVGLYEYGEQAVRLLKKYREKNPRKVTQKVITDLEKNLAK